MFKCKVTGKTSRPGEKMVKIVVETRRKTYNRLNAYGEVIGTSTGYETVRELCCSAKGAKDLEAKHA